MANINRDFVKGVVVGAIQSLMRDKDFIVNEEDSIVFDSILYGDDFGNVLIIEIEDKLKIRTPTSEWSNVYTVRQAIDLVARACAASEPESPGHLEKP